MLHTIPGSHAETSRPHATFLLPSVRRLFEWRWTSAPAATRPKPASVFKPLLPPLFRDSVASRVSDSNSQSSAPPSSHGFAMPVSLTNGSPCRDQLFSLSLATGVTPNQDGFSTTVGVPMFADTLTVKPDPKHKTQQWKRATGARGRNVTDQVTTPRLTRVAPDTLRCRRCGADLAFAAQVVSKGFTGRHGRAYLVSAPSNSPGAVHLYAPQVPPPACLDAEGWTSNHGDDTFGEADENQDDDISTGDVLTARNATRRSRLANILVGRSEHRQLATGPHVVADISCAQCFHKVGWKYVDARDAAQRYKVGKFILELSRIATFRSWEDTAGHAVDGENGCFTAVADATGTARHHMGVLAAANRSVAAQRCGQSAIQLGVAEDGMFSDGVSMDSEDAAVEFDSSDEDECEEIFAGTWSAAVVAERRREKGRLAQASVSRTLSLLDV